MNGTTTGNNGGPVGDEMDKNTWGWRWLNITTWGQRLVRIGIAGVYLDLYRARVGRWFIYARVRNGATVFFPGGALSWPMPDLLKPNKQT